MGYVFIINDTLFIRNQAYHWLMYALKGYQDVPRNFMLSIYGYSILAGSQIDPIMTDPEKYALIISVLLNCR